MKGLIMFKGKKLWGLSLAFTATAFWASFYIVGRYVFGENEGSIDPVFFTFLRFLMAGFFFAAVLTWKRKIGSGVSMLRQNLWIFIFLGLIGIVGEGVLVFWSLKYTTAARSSLFANTSPIFTVLLAIFALNEKCSWRKVLGMTIGFAGAAAAIAGRGQSDISISGTSIIGDLLALGSGICWAAYTVWGANVTVKHGSLLSTSASIMFGTIMLFILVIAGGNTTKLDFSWKLWLAIIYLGVFGNGLAYLCWYAALKYLKAGELGAFGYISAALSALMSFIFLKEQFTIYFFLALAGIIFGVYLLLEKNEPEKEIQEKV